MAGRAHSRAQAALAERRALEARETPTEPRTAPADYHPDLCLELEELASIGMVTAEVCAHWRISEETFAEWVDVHQAFKEAFQRARTRAKAWWQRQPRLALAEKDNKFPAGAWSQQVRALFPEYDDKRAVTVTLDLSQLVHVVIPAVPNLTGLPDEQSVGVIEARPIKGSVQHGERWTAEGSTQTALIRSDGEASESQESEAQDGAGGG